MTLTVAPFLRLPPQIRKAIYVQAGAVCDATNQPGLADLGCFTMSNPTGCFCKAWHSAHSSAYECNCWGTLTPLFLVSKAFRSEALEVFFGQNRFTILESPPCLGTMPRDHSPDRLSPSIFLSDIVPRDALQYLRNINIIFPAFGNREPSDYCPRDGPAWTDWNTVLQNRQSEFNCSRLAIQVQFKPWHGVDESELPAYRHDMTEDQSLAIQQTYKHIVMPLAQLRGLRGFSVPLTDPRQWHYVDNERSWHGAVDGRCVKFDTRLEKLEEEMKRFVLGDRSALNEENDADQRTSSRHTR